jgi:phosphonate transport system permease protein
VSTRPALLLLFAMAAVWGLMWIGEVPTVGAGGLQLVGELASAAFTPALWSAEGVFLLPVVLAATARTVAVAAAGLALAVVGAAVLTPLMASSGLASWPAWLRWPTWAVSRSTAAGLRSVHEVLWAILLLAAFGRSNAAAVLAIAIPYAGMLARVYAALLDEVDAAPAEALVRAGASPVQALLLARVPTALPDAVAYTLYRAECALRASAVLGFFGVPTLGYHLVAAADGVRFTEVWTYLYALIALVVAAEAWSAAVRARLVTR